MKNDTKLVIINYFQTKVKIGATMIEKITNEKMSRVFCNTVTKNMIEREDTSLVFYDMSFLTERINELFQLFPDSTLHAIAVKANPLVNIFKFLKSLNTGVEAASLSELYLAENVGFPPEKIVFDSPTKTIHELEYAMKLGVHINIDSLDELKRIAKLRKGFQTKSSFGIRINPQVGTGAILSTSVAGDYSKFGVPIKEKKEELIQYFLENEWLKGVHLHIGSQGCPVNLLVDGVKVVYDFVIKVNDILKKNNEDRQINIFDIGGGLPVSNISDEKTVTMLEYREMLGKHCNELFSGKFKLITEFGRFIHANAGWVASRVEYIKESTGIKTIIVHTGADLFLRECYQPEYWQHDISVLDCEGNIKRGIDKIPYVIAGPLCFAGDILSREIYLPKVAEGDYILIHDAGAYTLSMWSRYNSRQVPKVIGYHNDGEKFEILKERESLDDILRFWA
ncbi:diaminopimelate decarboxylase [Bacteroidota bacterium]